MEPRFYAGIGSRKTPDDILLKMVRIGKILESHGFILRSGGAAGADSAFEYQVPNSSKEIFIPNNDSPLWTNVFTDNFHPIGKKLEGNVRNIMNRNAMQILGRDGNTPVEFVICWTKDGKASGGTGQAIRIAEYYDIPIFNLKNEDAMKNFKIFMKNALLS